MSTFKNPQESHQHSKEVLEILYQYDSLLDSLEVVADFGCGHGMDTLWWASLQTRDDPPAPRNYTVYAIDKNVSGIPQDTLRLSNVHTFTEDMEVVTLPRKADLLWCHDSFQYLVNPMLALKNWNANMNQDAMLVISMPQPTHYSYNRLQANFHSYCYYNHNLISLMYMLATNGFDCRDAYFKKSDDDQWLYAAVYKSCEPMNPSETSWYTLAESNLINDSMVNCLTKYGHIRQEEVVVKWLDKDFGKIN